MCPNERQLEAWNAGESVHYVHNADRYDRQLAAVTEALIERARIEPTHTVLDVGCGCGVTTLAVAAKARRVLGVDISNPLVDVAIARARAAAVDNAEFVVADAQILDLGVGVYDVVISQFGLMFFDDPAGAFSNLRAALAPGGQMVFATWQPLDANGWLAPVLGAVAQFAEVPDLGGLTNGPGMFALEDSSEIAELLNVAGFTDIAVESTSPMLQLGGGGGVDESTGFLLDMGIVRGLLSHLDVEDRETAAHIVRAELERHDEAGVGVWLDAGVWLVSARRR